VRVLLTGATGLLGPYLADELASVGTVTTTGRRGGDHPCDLTDASAVADLLAAAAPDAIVHAAALTDVDRCESEPGAAEALNVTATRHLVQGAGGALIVQVSTDQVYDGAAAPHVEARVGPVNVYGRTKLAGEDAVRQHPRHLVLRTNVFGPSRTPGRASLSDFVTDGLREGRPITLFTDLRFSPLLLPTVARHVARSVASGLTGTYNLGSRDGMTKHEFGMAVAEELGLRTDTATAAPSTSVDGRAPRPSDLRLDVSAFEAATGTKLPTLRSEIARLGAAFRDVSEARA
jgi:dTDP-4-dehydrorhamnose reductase